MTNIPSTDTLTVGDRVVTAGLDLGTGIRSPFPRGLLVGTVIDIDSTVTEIVQSAVIQPAVDLDKLEYVLVITDFEPVIVPPPGGSPSPAPSPTPAEGP
jgi:cell shape-determining protein MreC